MVNQKTLERPILFLYVRPRCFLTFGRGQLSVSSAQPVFTKDKDMNTMNEMDKLIKITNASKPPETFRRSAELFVLMVKGDEDIQLGFDLEGITYLDNRIQIDRQRELTKRERNIIRSLSGAFLGECYIHICDGKWQQDDSDRPMPDGFTRDDWGVEFAGGMVVCPFGQVRNQFENGEEDSVLHKFSVASILSTWCFCGRGGKVERKSCSVKSAKPKFPKSVLRNRRLSNVSQL